MITAKSEEDYEPMECGVCGEPCFLRTSFKLFQKELDEGFRICFDPKEPKLYVHKTHD